MQSLDFLKVFIDPLEVGKISYFVTGSIASIFYGEPRLTHDIDIVIHLSQNDKILFPKYFPLEQFYCPPEDVIQIESRRQPYGHFKLIHHGTGFKADIYLDAGDKLYEWAFKNRKHIDLTKNLKLWLAPPEYIIIRKLEFFREGGSEKHIVDIKKKLPQLDESLNNQFLEKEIETRGLRLAWHQVQS